jgi:hypothetical protein
MYFLRWRFEENSILKLSINHMFIGRLFCNASNEYYGMCKTRSNMSTRIATPMQAPNTIRTPRNGIMAVGGKYANINSFGQFLPHFLLTKGLISPVQGQLFIAFLVADHGPQVAVSFIDSPYDDHFLKDGLIQSPPKGISLCKCQMGSHRGQFPVNKDNLTEFGGTKECRVIALQEEDVVPLADLNKEGYSLCPIGGIYANGGKCHSLVSL